MKINHKLLLLAVIFICAFAPKGADAKIDTQELSRRLAEDVQKLRIPGMAVVIVDPDEVLYSETFGNCETIETPFLIGSVSKTFTAVSIMKLVEEGKIDLDTSIADYLNLTAYLRNPSDGEKITVRQLLNHTSGLGEYQRFGNAAITETYGKYRYANVNYGILGKIIETVSGESYADFTERNIFRPLQMNHAAATLAKSEENGLIHGYRNYFGIPVPGELDYPTDKSWSTVPAGYISASAADMGKYLQMYLNHGRGILQPTTIDKMFDETIQQDESGLNYYGLGWMRTFQYSRPVILHAGLVENFASNVLILPNEGIGIAVLVNMNDYLVSNQFLENITRSLLGEENSDIPDDVYLKSHLMIDLIYLGILAISLLPVLFLRRWYRSEKIYLNRFFDILLHLIFPIVLLGIPHMLGAPLWVVWLFVKDLFFILILSAAVLLATGCVKFLLIRKKSSIFKEGNYKIERSKIRSTIRGS